MSSTLRILIASLAGLAAGGALAAFTDNGDGTLTDSATGLVWDKCAWGQSGATCASGAHQPAAWQTALQIAVTANQGGHKGRSDWRLPSKNELASIVDLSNVTPAIDTSAFPGTSPAAYWTSTPYFASPTLSWSINIGDGATGSSARDQAYYVRLVRGGTNGAEFDALAAAPVLSAVGVSGTTQTGTTLSATSSVAATGHWIVVPRGAAAPTSAQVQARVNCGAVTVLAGGSA